MLRVFDFHRDSVTSVAFSPDGKTIASAALDKNVIIADVATGRILRNFANHEDDVNAVAFSPDGKSIASGSRDQTIDIWDPASGEVLVAISEPATEVRALAFSPDGTILASAGADNIIRLWQASDGHLIRALDGHKSAPRAVTFSADGQLLASAGEDRLIKLWSVATGELLRTIDAHSSAVTTVVFAGRRLISGSLDRTIRVWDPDSGTRVRNIEGLTAPISSIASNADGSLMAAANWTSISLFSLDTAQAATTLAGRLSSVRSVAFSPDGRTLACATGNSVKIWDAGLGAFINSLEGHSAPVNVVAFSPAGKVLASASLDKTIRLWDVAAGKQTRALTGHLSNVSALAFSLDGKLIASGSVDKTVRLWSAETGAFIRSFEGHFSLVSAVAFSPNGRWIASGGYDNTVRLWDVETGKTVFTFAGHTSEVTGVAFSPDSRTVASSSRDKTVRLWEVQNGQPIRTMEGHASDVLAVAFSPDGRLIASAGYDKTIRLTDAQTGKLVRALADHSGPILSVTFRRDGKLIASASEDATIKIWSGAGSEPLCTLLGFSDTGDWLVVTPDGLFDGSPESWQSILWRFASNTFDVAPVEAFFNEFYHPGLLSELLRGKTPKAAKGIARADRRQPAVRLALAEDPAAGRAVVTRRVRVRIDIAQAPPDPKHPSGSGARDVRLFRNGALVKVWRGDVLGSQQSVSLEESVSILAGENRLTAYAFNRENIKSADATIRVRGSEGLKRRGTAYILIVGINEYANPQYNLKYAVADGQEFGEALRQAQRKLGTFSNVEVIQLFDREATRANILEALNRLGGKPGQLSSPVPAALDRIKAVEPEDAVIVYFAGHGTAQQARFYLIPHDLGYLGPVNALDEAGLNTLLAHSVSDRDLENAFESIDASDMLMVIDACNSGQALESEEKRRGPMNSKGLAQLAYEKGLYILTAAQGYQAALEAAELGHGFLTYALIVEGLKNGAADVEPRDGNILIREWMDYAVTRVPEMQASALLGERGLKVVTFVPGEENLDPSKRSIQRPRVFYRRELEAQPLIIEKLAGNNR
jgi:WD40 repeat protein